MEDKQDFQTLFNEKLGEHGISLRKLSEVSGIAFKHLENISFGRFEDLPPAPYLRGYLINLGHILEFDGEEWLESMKKDGLVQGAGARDQLPKNRFAQRPVRKKIIIGIVIAFAVFYIVFRLPAITGRPSINIISPSENSIITATDRITIEGTLSGSDQLTVNGDVTYINEDGRWQKNIHLQPGLNSIRVVAKKFLGRETEIIRHVIYYAQDNSTSTDAALP